MKILAIICLIIIALDVCSIPFQFAYDRLPRPAWKKSYAIRFAITSAFFDLIIVIFIIAYIRGF